jgi:hypothetical protein
MLCGPPVEHRRRVRVQPHLLLARGRVVLDRAAGREGRRRRALPAEDEPAGAVGPVREHEQLVTVALELPGEQCAVGGRQRAVRGLHEALAQRLQHLVDLRQRGVGLPEHVLGEVVHPLLDLDAADLRARALGLGGAHRVVARLEQLPAGGQFLLRAHERRLPVVDALDRTLEGQWGGDSHRSPPRFSPRAPDQSDDASSSVWKTVCAVASSFAAAW